jgi:hypothetical protein
MNRIFSTALALWLAIGGCCALMAIPASHGDCCPHETSTDSNDCTCCFAVKVVPVDAALPPALLPVSLRPIVFAPLFEIAPATIVADQSGLYLALRVLRI